MSKNKESLAITGAFPSKKELINKLESLNIIENCLFKANSPKDYVSPRKKLIVENAIRAAVTWPITGLVFFVIPPEYMIYAIVIFVIGALLCISEFVHWLGKTPETYIEMMSAEFCKYIPFDKERYDTLKSGIENSGTYHLGNIKSWINEERREIRAFMGSE